MMSDSTPPNAKGSRKAKREIARLEKEVARRERKIDRWTARVDKTTKRYGAIKKRLESATARLRHHVERHREAAERLDTLRNPPSSADIIAQRDIDRIVAETGHTEEAVQSAIKDTESNPAGLVGFEFAFDAGVDPREVLTVAQYENARSITVGGVPYKTRGKPLVGDTVHHDDKADDAGTHS